MNGSVPNKFEKCQGAMLATAIGDALGWPNEKNSKNISNKSISSNSFIEWKRRCGRPYWHCEKIYAGEYSDDTQITLAIARSIIAGDWEDSFANKELPFWLSYERGGGKALRYAAKSYNAGNIVWKSAHKTEYFNAGGNGAVMRILPHVISNAFSNDIKHLISDVIKDSIITHGHPRAILGATCYAFALDYLLKKQSILEYGELVSAIIKSAELWTEYPNYEELSEWQKNALVFSDYDYQREWHNTSNKMLKQLEYIKQTLDMGLLIDDVSVLTKLECFGDTSGAGDVAILAAVYFASKYANSPVLGVTIPAFSYGIDTDTIASITGGLLGMLCGTSWIPFEWQSVQDYDCILKVTELLLEDNKKESAKSFVSCVKEKEKSWKHTPIGSLKAIDSIVLANGKTSSIIEVKWQSTLGQTIYIKENRVNTDSSSLNNDNYESVNKYANENRPQNKTAPNSAEFQLSLTNQDIIQLKNEPMLKTKTFGTILKIIELLLKKPQDIDYVSKKLKVDKQIVDLLSKYIKAQSVHEKD